MSTKKQRLAQRTAGGEPSLSLPAFAAAMPASALPSAGACASVPDCYLVYCYLCRTGLWREMTPLMSPCGTLYLACEPEIHPVTGRQRKEPAAALPVAVAADAAAPAAACEDAEMADKDEAEDDEISSSSGGDDDDEPPSLQAPPADAAAAASGAPHADAGASAPVTLPVVLPAPLPASAEAEGQAFRERTMMVPLSIANVATTPDRLQQLQRISEVEGGAPVSLAFVDSDGTVIVTYMYAGLVPPEVLQGAESEDEDDDGALLATVLPDDEPAAAGAEAAAGAGAGAGADKS